MAGDLVTCPNCNKVFASKLKTCPHCSGKRLGKGCLWLFGGIIGLAVIGAIVGPSDQKQTPSEQTAAVKPDVPQAPQNAIMALTAAHQGQSLLVVGRTNLPFGTQMLVNIETPAGATLAQDNATVGEFGRFYAGAFSTEGSALPDGRYVVHVVAAVADVQPDTVKPAIGKDWANFLGPLKSSGGVVGPVIEASWPIRWRNADATALETVLPAGEQLAQASAQWASDAEKARVAARAAAWQEKREDAFFACQTFIKRNLRDPDSADFMTDYNEALVSKDGESGYQVMQQVRANNGFGGKTVSIFLCQTHLSGDNWELDNVKEQN
jgi:hypothetical protein